MRNWKTTLCGILSALFAGLVTIGLPPVPCQICGLLSTAMTSLGLMFSRDFNVTSEQSGLKPQDSNTSTSTPSSPGV